MPDDERVCDICWSAPRAVRFHPCGHSVACELCTLQLIAKCPGSTKAESLFCPHCKSPISKIERDRAGAPTPLRRQNTFVPSAFDPLSVVGHAMTAEQEGAMTAEQEGAAAASGVLEFIESLKHATDEETRAAAHAASKTWSSGTPQAAPPPEALAQLLAGYAQLGGNPQAVLAQHQAFQQARVPPHPLVRAITGALAAAFLCVFAWGMHAIDAIRVAQVAPSRERHEPVSLAERCH
jgi:hypothetical protein